MCKVGFRKIWNSLLIQDTYITFAYAIRSISKTSNQNAPRKKEEEVAACNMEPVPNLFNLLIIPLPLQVPQLGLGPKTTLVEKESISTSTFHS